MTIIICILTISSFIIYLSSILNNKISFQTDEAYWVSTAKIIPKLFTARFKDPFWKEYYGFTNFNGAKYVYGIGLLLFKHTEKDIDLAGIAPYTYYNWRSYDGNAFPEDNKFYPILRDARIISSIFISFSVGLMAFICFLIFQNVIAGTLGGIFLFIHPITQYVATHAFSDSFLLFFILLLIIGIYMLFQDKADNNKKYQFIIHYNAIILAYLVSIKINGLLFLGAMSFLAVWMYITKIKYKEKSIYISSVIKISFEAMLFFLLLHPNFFFFPNFNPLQMIQDRITITSHHIALYSKINPSHVILTIPDRLNSLIKHCFPLWILPFFCSGLAYILLQPIIHKKKAFISFFYQMLILGYVTFIGVLTYVVFDEIRYYLPLLPFIIIISLGWVYPFLDILKHTYKTVKN